METTLMYRDADNKRLDKPWLAMSLQSQYTYHFKPHITHSFIILRHDEKVIYSYQKNT